MRSREAIWFLVSVGADGTVRSDSWLPKWGRPTKAKAEEIGTRAGNRVTRLVRAGEVESTVSELRAA